jgi:fluoride exporter
MPEAARRNGVDHRSSVAAVTYGHRAWMLVAVALGGALGTMARYELALAEPVGSGRFPWATFGANVAGSLVLGIAVVVWADQRTATGVARAFVAVGICGGLTTFSTWMVESVLLTRDGDSGLAAVYLVLSLLAGFAAVALGVTAARRLVHRPVPVFDPELDD